MSILNDPNFMPLTRDEIVFSCVFTYLSEDEEMQLKRSIACDMEYRRVRWENGVEALMAMSSNQPLLTNEQLERVKKPNLLIYNDGSSGRREEMPV